MRKHPVMFVDRARHQPMNGGDAIERVEEEPVMRQGPPPRVDHRVRALQFRQGQQTAQDARGNQCVDLRVHVLRARVRQHDWDMF